MLIRFSPMRDEARLMLERQGETLIVNGQPLDLGAVPEGGRVGSEVFGCPWLISDVVRQGGRLEVVLILPHGADAPEATLFPEPLLVAVDGPVTLPPGSGAG
jgi:hypothetical protein